MCLLIKKHYDQVNRLKKKLDQELQIPIAGNLVNIPAIDSRKPTGVFLVKDLGAAMHSILWVQRMFPEHFKNFVFVSQGVVDIGSFGSEKRLEKLQKDTERVLNYLTKFSQHHGFAVESYSAFGTDPVNDIVKMAEEINQKYSNAIYFSFALCLLK